MYLYILVHLFPDVSLYFGTPVSRCISVFHVPPVLPVPPLPHIPPVPHILPVPPIPPVPPPKPSVTLGFCYIFDCI